jgi:phosphoserine phosphatase
MDFDLVAFDMDGVLISCRSSWQMVHGELGTDNREDLEAYVRGEIDDGEFIRRDLAKWMERGIETRSDLEAILSKAPRAEGLLETIDSLRGRVKTAIVSAGLDIIAKQIAEESGIEYVLANGLEVDGDGRLVGRGIVKVPLRDKGKPFVDLCRSLSINPRRAVAIGNSSFDIPMFEQAGLGIALNPVDEEVERISDAIVRGSMVGILAHIFETQKRRF